MRLTRESIKGLLGSFVYSLSLKYFQDGRVIKYKKRPGARGETIQAVVRGNLNHNVDIEIPYDDDALRFACDCHEYASLGRCKHIGAVLLESVDQAMGDAQRAPNRAAPAYAAPAPRVSSPPMRAHNSASATILLTRYMQKDAPKAPGSIRLVPQLNIAPGVAEVSFTIGDDRQYVLKDLHEFQKLMDSRATAGYGAKLQFAHTPDAFTEKSQQLLKYISAFVNEQKTYMPLGRAFVSPPPARAIPLTGRALDELFDLYAGEKIANREGGERWSLVDGDPALSLDITQNGALIKIELTPKAASMAGAKRDYAIVGREIYRLSEEYAARMMPMIASAATGDMLFSPSGASEFCQSVLPRVERFAPVIDENPLKPYKPDALEVRFYIDMPQRNLLTAEIKYMYGETALTPEDPAQSHPEIRRDAARERAAVQALIAHFDPPQTLGDPYRIDDEARMYAFLTGGIETLDESGEIYISDRLKNIAIKKLSRVTVGVSAGEGMLSLNVDTGEFPIQELEELMRAVREKRRYYRLTDGRFLPLKGGELDSLAQMADGLNLSASDLEKGQVEVPMSRALYLDSALKQDGDLAFNRDDSFRKLVRDFRTVDDSDFEVPEPLTDVLRNYQKTGFRWLKTLDAYRFGGILADDMGLGKTLQVLTYLLSVKRERQEDSALPRASLIICPSSLVLNWGEEAAKWTPELRVCLLCGAPTAREMEIMRRDEYDIIVTSYDLLRRDEDAHRDARYYACILDEAQYIKNHDTKTFQAVKNVNALVRVALTGTPVENRLSELWSLFDFLMPGYLYKYEAFRQKLESPIAKNGDEGAKRTLQRMVSPFILRRMKKDVLSELPPKVETVNLIQMGEAQRKMYLAHAQDVKTRMEETPENDKVAILTMLLRLRQLCCDPALCIEGYEDESCKLEECARMLEELTESGHAVLVFSQFTKMLARIAQRLDEMNIACFTLQGDTPREERMDLVRRFNAGEVPVFLISLKAGGTGLNLTAADTVIHYDPWWNIAAQNQATDRCYRIGQTRKVQVYQLIAKNTIEENILKLQSQKRILADTVTEQADGGIMGMSKDELIQLLD